MLSKLTFPLSPCDPSQQFADCVAFCFNAKAAIRCVPKTVQIRSLTATSFHLPFTFAAIRRETAQVRTDCYVGISHGIPPEGMDHHNGMLHIQAQCSRALGSSEMPFRMPLTLLIPRSPRPLPESPPPPRIQHELHSACPALRIEALALSAE